MEANGTDCSAGVTFSWTTTASNAANYKLIRFDQSNPSAYETIYSGSDLTYTDNSGQTGTLAYQIIVEDAQGNDIGWGGSIIVDWDTCTITDNSTDPLSSPAVVGTAIVGVNTVGNG